VITKSLRISIWGCLLIAITALIQSSGEAIHAATRTSSDVSFSLTPLPKSLTDKGDGKLNPLDKAYLDAYTILKDDNQCSRLYGGPSALQALTDFVLQLKPVYLDKSIAIRMSGRTTNFQSHRTGLSYRLFEKAEVNLGGPFYRSSAPTERRTSLVHNFHANTRATRVVALLHELGHLVKVKDKWLLPDDGTEPNLSVKNSEFVTEACREQIELVIRMKSTEQLAQAVTQAAKESVAP
jgi:hypothetical protein